MKRKKEHRKSLGARLVSLMLAADLPAEEGVSWKFGMDPDAAAGYEFFDVTEENIEDYPLLGGDPAKCGWYFVLTTDFTITVEMRDGDKSSNTELFAEAVNSQFRLQGHAATGVTDVPFGEVDWKKPEITSGISSAEMTCTVRKFNLDGSRITYKIIFDNTGVPNFGAITTEVYDGGKILLTLAGQTDFTATKEWLEPEGTARPEATFELWRYRAGQDYTTAAAVRDNGEIVSCKADPDQDPQTQLVNEDGERVDGAQDNLRKAGDHFVYNTGVLSNRYNETVTVKASKEWKAAAFQADFEDAAVELRLQSRPAGDEDAAWEDTDETLVMGNFRSEHLINTGAATVPRYDAQGRELAYRWVETGVYQDIPGETIPGDAENLMGEDGSFVMTHTVENTSGSADDPATVDREIVYEIIIPSLIQSRGIIKKCALAV